MQACRRLGLFLGIVKPTLPPNRTVYIGKPRQETDPDVQIPQQFPNNRITSSKYTALNFLPKNLFEQFQRIANFYFLCVGIIQLVIDSPVSPVTSILPLVFVISTTAIKQGYEDWLRHKSDNEVNYRPATIVRDGSTAQVPSMDIKVGDIVKVTANHSFPCDLVMLSSHDPEGTCYITTANLDGETSLKSQKCISETRRYQSVEQLSDLQCVIECEQPVPDLYRFIGRMNIHKPGGTDVVHPLSTENILLRGARLRNTPYIFGCATYTGQETKMALNCKHKKGKFSVVERTMNRYLVIFLLLLLLETAVCTGLKYWYASLPRIGNPWYVPPESDIGAALLVVQDFFAFLVLFNYIIPISLYVTIELQKFIGSMFFGWDMEMYDEETNQRAQANTSDLNEELGQVEYLFTDKTGTLTENDMQFRQCSVSGQRYVEVGGMLCEKPDIPGVQPQFLSQFKEDLETFLIVLTLCHTVRVDHSSTHANGASSVYSPTGFDYDYQASSPDEKALIEACRRYGIVFHGSHDNMLEITVKNKKQSFKLLHTLDFDPTRKRMSVIVQTDQNKVYLLCKGAESAILDRVVSGDKVSTLQHVNEYAMLGLRTLVIADRLLTSDEFLNFDKVLREAQNSLTDRAAKLLVVYESLETNLRLLGATAVEDRLQDGVPETIHSLRAAGIKIWVLTGDKEETAVNISYSAGHFHEGMLELRLTQCPDADQCGETIKRHISRIELERSGGSCPDFVLIVDGASMAVTMLAHGTNLLRLCQMCIAVLCCRMTPLQKSEIVKLVKTSKERPTTAAIGDGANDVSMIQEAHVGLGIMGKEGRQAVRNSDYAFARFRFLLRALLFHGHNYYTRVATLVQYFFYKNLAFITAQVYYAVFSAFSEQTLYESYFLLMYNLTFTSLPILIFGLFEQSISQNMLLSKPELYRNIRKNKKLSVFNFLKWNSLALWHSVVSFFGVYMLFRDGIHLSFNGREMGNFAFGTIVITICVIVVNIKLGLETYYWAWPFVLSFMITVFGFIVMTVTYSAVIWSGLLSTFDFYYVYMEVFSSGTVWLTMLLLVITCLLPDIILRAFHDTMYHQGKPQTSRLRPRVGPRYIRVAPLHTST